MIDLNNILLIALVALGGVLVVAALLFVLTRGKSSQASWKPEVRSRLTNIANSTDRNNIQSLKFSVMEYDKLLDYTFQKMGIRGNTLGERLKASGKLFRNRDQYDLVWRVHKVRNNIAHDVSYNPHSNELIWACSNFNSIIDYLLNNY